MTIHIIGGRGQEDGTRIAEIREDIVQTCSFCGKPFIQRSEANAAQKNGVEFLKHNLKEHNGKAELGSPGVVTGQ